MGSVTEGVHEKERLEQTVALINLCLGSGYTDLDSLTKTVARPETTLTTSYADGEVSAAVICHRYTDPEDFFDSVPHYQRSKIESLYLKSAGNREGSIGVIKTMAVSPRLRGQGLGAMLTQISMDEFRKHGVTEAYSFGWTDHEGCHIQKTLERAGFRELEFITNYFKQLSIELGFDCPSCGNPCDCSIKLFHASI